MDEFFPTEGIAPRWSVGGGTILATDWNEHRRSTDVDGKIQLPAPGQTKRRLCELARELAESTPEGGARTTLDAYVESYGGVLIPAPAGMEHMRTYGFPTGRIDLLEPEEPGLWPMEPVQIGQRVVFRERRLRSCTASWQVGERTRRCGIRSTSQSREKKHRVPSTRQYERRVVSE